MILSCSRRTDVPAFYSRWFGSRLQAGWCEVPNPFSGRSSRVSLLPEDVDAIVFWTRHARPMFDLLPELDRRGIRHYFQYTITGYDRRLEPHGVPLAAAMRTFRELAARRLPGAVVWRYDPILLGAALPAAQHVDRFRRIADALAGSTRRVVLSLMDCYRKTERRVGEVMAWDRDVLRDPSRWPGVEELLAELAGIAREHGMTPEACSEAADYSALGIGRTRCVDDRLLRELYGGDWPAQKDRGQRAECGCIRSRDLGVNDTCLFGCRYCYATRSHELARRRHAEHDPEAAAIWQPAGGCGDQLAE